MPRTKKKSTGKAASGAPAKARREPESGPERPSREPESQTTRSEPRARGVPRPAPKKRGWRDIEALSERARLKKMLSDIWHEDIELEEDIFGETDLRSAYYADNRPSEVEIEPAEDAEYEEYEDFEEEE